MYTEQVNKIALGSNDDKRLQALIELHHIHMVQVLKSMQNRGARICKYKMINYDDYTNENKASGHIFHIISTEY